MKAVTLILIPNQPPSLTPGFAIVTIGNKRGIHLPKINDNIPDHKRRALIDDQKPASVKSNDKVYDVHIQLNEGQSFRDENSHVTIQHPRFKDKQTLILADRRWTDLSIKVATGRPNGSLAPGMQAFKDNDAIIFTWEDHNYVIHQVAEQVLLEKSSQQWETAAIESQIKRIEKKAVRA